VQDAEWPLDGGASRRCMDTHNIMMEAALEREQFRLKVKEIVDQADRLDSAKDHRGAIAQYTQGIELTEAFLRDHPEMSAAFGRFLPDFYHLRASTSYKVSQTVAAPEKKTLLSSARKDIDKALSYPDAYYTRDKAYLKKLKEAIK
jgi:hypothetical protein